ncbi:MAG: ferritin family protein [Candidatus Omnitrophica bacterium]|nr:ferritin family protein [Candidatus Omnitrophota bacterium]MDD5311345.1 ferritin family protein [Candidatus Omnitrophota bacterium]
MKIEYKGDEIIISDFKPLEAYKIARRLEAEGINFYSIFLSSVDDVDTEKAVYSLLTEERKHLKFFNQKVEEISGPFDENSIVDEIDTKVFGPFGESVDLASIIKDENKAIDLGILFEKRSVSFFKACLGKTSDATAKKAFEDIIKEEEKHLESLIEILKTRRNGP